MLKLIFLSSALKSTTLAVTSCPTCNTSEGFSIWSLEIWETCNRASTPGSSSTKAPKSVILATLPVTTLPTAYLLSASFHGFVSSNFRLSAIFVPSISLIRAFTWSPNLNTFLGFSTCPHDISEIWRSPSAPPRSINTPKSVTFLTVPSTTSPTFSFAKSSFCASSFLATISCLRSPM